MNNKIMEDIHETLRWGFDLKMFSLELETGSGKMFYASKVDNIFWVEGKILINDDFMEDEYSFEMHIDISNVKEIVIYSSTNSVKLINAEFCGITQDVVIKFWK